jgi:exodeoxyribonuclease-5
MRDAFGAHRSPEELLETALVCWMNRTRNALNGRIRALRLGEPPGLPRAGEIVVNLKNWRAGADAVVANGLRGIVRADATEDDDEPWRLRFPVAFEGDRYPRHVRALAAQFGRDGTFSTVEDLANAGIHVERMGQVGQLLDFGYALTVHKAQGSGFKHVIVVTDMPQWHADWRTWAYTAITRARSKLTIVTRGAR